MCSGVKICRVPSLWLCFGYWLRAIPAAQRLMPKCQKKEPQQNTFRGRELCRTTPSANRNFLNARGIHIVCSSILQTTDAVEVLAVIKGVNVGLLITTEQNAEMTAQSKNIMDVAIILEERIVLRELRDVPNGFAVLIGLLYCLNIDYPKELKYTFEVIQKVIMDIGGSTCSARVHGLRNKLLQRTV